MRSRSVVGSILILASLTGVRSWAQQESSPEKSAVGIHQPSSSAPDAVRILYTGKSFGYFRIPDWQIPEGSNCGAPDRDQKLSAAAEDFEQLLRENRVSGSILLGAGDNFSPELGARIFACSPEAAAPNRYPRLGKELFFWDPQSRRWLLNEEARRRGKESLNGQKRLAVVDGTSIIPFDNVANFFIQEGYAAMVPGKQDFHLGPERLRDLARYMASTPIPRNNPMLHGESVQMLAANLVIETTWKSDHKRLPDSQNPPWFVPHLPKVEDLLGHIDVKLGEKRIENSALRFIGLSDHGMVYPWFQGPIVQVWDRRLADALRKVDISLCRSVEEGDPNALPNPSSPTAVHHGVCAAVSLKRTRIDDENVFRLQFPTDDARMTTLQPGQNYGLCISAPQSSVTDADGTHMFCMRFSVYTPFFQFPWIAPKCRQAGGGEQPCYRDPDPYVLLEQKDSHGVINDVAIFGVVDPHLVESIGMLNLGWYNLDNQYKTETVVKDPVEAIREMNDYFQQNFAREHPQAKEEEENGKRRLFKVLLAQMPPPEAAMLQARLGDFQVVVSAADQEVAYANDSSTMKWTSSEGKDHYPSFLAIPGAYYVPKNNEQRWIVDIASLSLKPPAGAERSWEIDRYHLQRRTNLNQPALPHFWHAVESTLLDRGCLPQEFPRLDQTDGTSKIDLLTLCAMQKHTDADVALLQKRDFFAELPRPARDIRPDLAAGQDLQLQRILDRILWKGDFVSVMYVPGSALKRALEQSKAFDADDKYSLARFNGRNRGLLWLGVRFDNEQNEYLVNGLPVEMGKLYAIATSDFIGAGDTGYPDLAASQVRPPRVHRDFDKSQDTLSGIVCRQIAGAQADADCLKSLDRETYFDAIAMAPSDATPGATPLEQLRHWSIFNHPATVPGEAIKSHDGTLSVLESGQQEVEQRPLWDFKLAKWSLGITTLGHSGSDYQVQNDFGGITTPGINAFRSTTWTSDFQAQWTRSWQHNQIFIAPAYSYNVQHKGQPDDLRQVNQIADLGMFDLGFAHLFNGRGPEHYDFVFTSHFETPLARTFAAFPLTTSHTGPHGQSIKDQIRFDFDRSYTEFVRPGFRWHRRISSIEAGPEWGHEWNALQGISFTTNGMVTSCSAQADVSLSQCIKNATKGNPASIAPNSLVTTQRSGEDHSGVYWRLSLTIPFHPRVSYVLTDTGDWFFVHYGSENSTTTLFRDYSQHQLRFMIFPSFSIGPEFDLLLYENKGAGGAGGHFLRQNLVMMKAQFNFDWFNTRRMAKQIEYAPAPGPK